MGDIVMSGPAISALKNTFNCRITLLTSKMGSPIVPHMPGVDDVIIADMPWVKTDSAPSAGACFVLAEKLRSEKFDLAVIFTVYSQSALPAAMLCYLAGIPRRLAHCRENPYALLTDWVSETEPQNGVRHEVERQLALVARVGAVSSDMRMRFDVSAQARRALDARLAARGIPADSPCFVIHPGASAASRRYPAERFGEAAAHLVRATSWPILLTGTAGEAPLIDEVIDAAGSPARAYLHDFSGELSIAEFAALIERTAVLVTNNSGPVHLASALATPVVDLYALTNPQHTPWKTEQRVLFRDVECRWCYRGVCPQEHHACLLGVPAVEVAAAALELAASNAPAAVDTAVDTDAASAGAPISS